MCEPTRGQPKRDPQGRDQFTERRPRRGTGDGRRASAEEADMRREWKRDREDSNRQSIGHLRQEAFLLRQELRTDIEKVSDASRERDRELHKKIDDRHEKFDERLDGLKADTLKLDGKFTTVEKLLASQDRDEFADVPWYARPSYIKAMGLAVAAVLSALIVSLGVVFGWGPTTVPLDDAPSRATAPENPGDAADD